MLKPSSRSKNKSGVKSIRWSRFKIARVVLVASFFILILYFAYWKEFLMRNFMSEIMPIKVKMLVTAYYHPLPKQKFYYTGSYWQDLALNGYGITFLANR